MRVILASKDEQKRVFSSIQETCRRMNFKYNTLIRKKTPFEHQGWKIERLELEKYSCNNLD
jgi:hypothetical protein